VSDLVKAFQYWKQNPVEAVKDWFKVTPEPYQADILNDLLGPVGISRVAGKSGHGVGKTTTEAWCAWVYLMTRPHSRVVATAPTAHQLIDVLWPEIAKWHVNMPEEFKDQWEISATHVRHKQFDKTWFATARTSNKPENMQGFHNQYILVIMEEASGVQQAVCEVIEGILSNAEEHDQEAKLLMMGNPTQTMGEFYNAFHKNKTIYKRYTISGDLVLPVDPNGGKLYISPRVSNKYRDTMARKYGRDSAVYDVRVRGLFPRQADYVVIPMEYAEAATRVQLPTFDKLAHPFRLVMDVARFGGDETVLGIFRGKHCVDMKAWPKTSTNECVDILHEYYHRIHEGAKVADVIVDEPGVGGGVVDGARRVGIPVVAYNGGATMKTDYDPEPDVRMFANRRSRDWWNVRRLMEQGGVRIPDDEDLVNQLASVKYDYFNEKIKVETKKEMRERLGDDASPDRADVIVMGLAPFVSYEMTVPTAVLDLLSEVFYGGERPTSDMDF